MQCRKSVSDLTPGEKTTYRQAVLDLKTAPSRIPNAQTAVTNGGGTPNRYDDYVWIHNVIGGGAHRGPAFGPWHRELLRQFELDLRQVSGNPDICIPYWDWTTARGGIGRLAVHRRFPRRLRRCDHGPDLDKPVQQSPPSGA